jgi:hypothetical protein
MSVLDQRHMALEIANRRRMSMATQRREIGAMSRLDGRDRVASLLVDPSLEIVAMPVGRLLLSIHRVGVKKVGWWLNLAEIRSADRRVGELTDRQRLSLVDILRAEGTA